MMLVFEIYNNNLLGYNVNINKKKSRLHVETSVKNKTVRIGIIGAGARSQSLVNQLLSGRNGLEVTALCDINKQHCKDFNKKTGISPETTDDYRGIIKAPEIDWVMVFSPNALHAEHITAAFEAGKHVFGEKPLATTLADCIAIREAHLASGKKFATGFVLRYTPLSAKIKWVLESGYIGDVISIQANENLRASHGSHIMMGWRRFTRLSGPHILEKCCHDLDLINWFTESLPSRAASFGGLNFFTPENKHYHEEYTGEDGKSPFDGWDEYHDEACPFTSKKDIIDNQVAILEYRNGVRVCFQTTLSNAIPERRMYFSCTRGTMIADSYWGTLQVQRLGEDIENYDFKGKGSHGGGDIKIMEQLYSTMMNGDEPACSGEEGIDSTVTALAVDQARVENRIVDIEPVWKKLGK